MASIIFLLYFSGLYIFLVYSSTNIIWNYSTKRMPTKREWINLCWKSVFWPVFFPLELLKGKDKDDS